MLIDPRKDALLVIDLQPDFLPGGPLAVADGHAVTAGIAALTTAFRTVVATQDWHPLGHASFASTHGRAPFSSVELYGEAQTLWPDHCVQGTAGAAVHESLPMAPLSMILRKGASAEVDSYSAFRENLGPDQRRRSTGLGAWLTSRGVTRVFVAGLARDFCVRFTCEDAAIEGFQVCLLDDLTRPVDPSSKSAVDLALSRVGVRQLDAAELAGGSMRRP